MNSQTIFPSLTVSFHLIFSLDLCQLSFQIQYIKTFLFLSFTALNIDELLGIISSTEAELSDIEPPKKRSRTLFLPSDDEDDTTIRELLNDLIDHVSAENSKMIHDDLLDILSMFPLRIF